jgi:4,5-dihydroxyphthalate decarboxylase
MANLQLSFACSDYDRTRALANGAVVPEGIDLQLIRSPEPAEIFRRMLHDAEFDVSEMSLSNYIMGLARGDTRFVGLPVFPYRAFRHSMLWVNDRSGIREPGDLRGKRVGIPDYAVTALLYARGMLQHEYGVLPSDVHWFRGRTERVALDLPSDVRIEQLPPDASLEELLERGELDAIASFTTPRAAGNRSGPVRRLFSSAREVEADYYRRTRIFPIMHLIVLRRDIYERAPWVARSLLNAFQAAKEWCYQDLERDVMADSVVLTPWLRHHWEEARAVFGGEIYPNGVAENLPTLEAAMRFSYEQHLSARQLSVEELFAAETLDSRATPD